MNGIPARHHLDIAAAAPDTGRAISVEIAGADRLADIRTHWTDLLNRAAEPNVFMDPALTGVAHDIEPARGHRALLAWTNDGGHERLTGIWSIAVGHARRSIQPWQ